MSKHISIVTLNQMLSPTHRTAGGLENYVYQLNRLMQDMGYATTIFQNSFTGSRWETEYEGSRLIAVPNGQGRPPQSIYQETGSNVLYAWYGVADQYVYPGVTIAHGIHYNDPRGGEYAFDGIKPWYRKALEQNKLLVCVDSIELNLLRATMPSLAYPKTKFIVNYADTTRFTPNHRKSDGKVRVLYPRRLDDPRGIYVMYNVVPRLLRKYPHLYFDFVIDQNNEGKYNEFTSWYNAQENKDRITYKSMLYTDIHTAYHEADIVVAPTMYSEGSSLTVVEAICSGVPVVTTNVGGINDIAIHLFNALVTDPQESLFEKALEELIEDKKLRVKLGENGASMAPAFSLDRWRVAWSKIIEANY